MPRVLIIGATDSVAQATARRYAERGARLFLVAPEPARIEAIAADLRVRGAEGVVGAAMVPGDFARHRAVIAEADASLGGIDLALIAPPSQSDRQTAEDTGARIRDDFAGKALSTLSLLTELAHLLEPRGGGTLAVLSSVAGERGRRTDPLSSAALASVTVFLQGLRGRLGAAGVQVLTVKLGPADGPYGQIMALPEPSRIARRIVRAVDRRRDLVYAPALWAPAAWLLRALPEAVLKRLPF
ncbi:MAG: SDR family NAD(P)-dependent oxidoreductase [Chromatiaceae bacterium]|jgi:NAD(P)-dependent dehydrogenase (short-subunit alcohol dehydrogenase family)|nr:SDR family NAD(P)-dependent oxidoreductase [Chromatiaceae bacterium]